MGIYSRGLYATGVSFITSGYLVCDDRRLEELDFTQISSIRDKDGENSIAQAAPFGLAFDGPVEVYMIGDYVANGDTLDASMNDAPNGLFNFKFTGFNPGEIIRIYASNDKFPENQFDSLGEYDYYEYIVDESGCLLLTFYAGERTYFLIMAKRSDPTIRDLIFGGGSIKYSEFLYGYSPDPEWTYPAAQAPSSYRNELTLTLVPSTTIYPDKWVKDDTDTPDTPDNPDDTDDPDHGDTEDTRYSEFTLLPTMECVGSFSSASKYFRITLTLPDDAKRCRFFDDLYDPEMDPQMYNTIPTAGERSYDLSDDGVFVSRTTAPGKLFVKYDSASVEDPDFSLDLYGWSCLTKDTKILLADGTEKRFDDLSMTDILLDQNLGPTRILKITRGEFSKIHTLYHFSDGTVIDESHEHRFYNVDQGFWQKLRLWNIGDRARKYENGEIYDIWYVGKSVIEEPCEMFGLWTATRTYFANGLLSGDVMANIPVLHKCSIRTAIDILGSVPKELLRRGLA